MSVRRCVLFLVASSSAEIEFGTVVESRRCCIGNWLLLLLLLLLRRGQRTAIINTGIDLDKGNESAVTRIPHQGGRHHLTVGKHHVQPPQSVVLLLQKLIRKMRAFPSSSRLECVIDGLDRLISVRWCFLLLLLMLPQRIGHDISHRRRRVIIAVTRSGKNRLGAWTARTAGSAAQSPRRTRQRRSAGQHDGPRRGGGRVVGEQVVVMPLGHGPVDVIRAAGVQMGRRFGTRVKGDVGVAASRSRRTGGSGTRPGSHHRAPPVRPEPRIGQEEPDLVPETRFAPPDDRRRFEQHVEFRRRGQIERGKFFQQNYHRLQFFRLSDGEFDLPPFRVEILLRDDKKVLWAQPRHSRKSVRDGAGGGQVPVLQTQLVRRFVVLKLRN